MSSDDSTLGEKMNHDLYLDPGFSEDKPSLVGALRDDIDETVERAQANLDRQRAEADADAADLADQP